MGNIFNALAQKLRFNYSIALPREVTTGSPQPDGSWTGSMGMLHRNESDLALGPFFPATERLGIAKPCAMVYVEELRILAGRTASQETSVFGYILAFDWMVWMFLSVALVTVSVLTALFTSLHAAKAGHRSSFVRNIGAALWMYLENLFLEASPHVPKLAGPRFLSAVWWIAVVVLMNAFCGHMRACLMIKPEVEKIESAHHLVRRPHVVPHMWLGTSYVSMVSGSSNPDLRQIGRTIRERRTAVPTSVLYGESLLRQVTRGRAAIISDSMSLTFRVTAVCQAFVGAEFYLAREGVVSHPLNSLARKDIDPVMFKDINKGIQRLLEAGLIDLWFSRAKGDVGRCRGSSTSGEPDLASPLALTDVFGVFVLWMACIGISCLFFVAETCARCAQKTACHLAPKPADRGRHTWHERGIRR
ncbi:putative glutamate receptor [Haemaphysalis longicornis]